MRRFPIVVLLLALALAGLAAGCGGDDEASGDTDTTAITEETTTDETATGETETPDLGDFASADCLELISAGAALAQAFATAGTGAEVEDFSELMDRLIEKAPDEIRADIQILADGFAAYAEALRDLDLEPGQVPSAEDLQQIQAALASVDQPEIQAASERLSTWAEENCPGG